MEIERMNSPKSAMKFPAFQMALLLVVMVPSFGAQPLPPKLSVDGIEVIVPSGQTVFSCNTSNFVDVRIAGTSAPCAIGPFGANPTNGFNVTGATYSIEGGAVYLGESAGGGGHIGVGMTYQKPVNVQAFTATFTFVPNGKNLVFVLQNATNNRVGFNGRNFSSGAGCEAGFYQSFDTDTPNSIFGLELDSFSPLNSGSFTFTYSSAMIYSYRQSPCIPQYSPSWSNPTPAQTVPTKISTSPVPLNSPASTALTTTRHNYSATIAYDGSNVTLSLYDITAGGACPGAGCFTHTWNGVNIPSLVGANTAWVGITGGCNSDCPSRINVNSFTYKN
jgi:hypothetical protein